MSFFPTISLLWSVQLLSTPLSPICATMSDADSKGKQQNLIPFSEQSAGHGAFYVTPENVHSPFSEACEAKGPSPSGASFGN